MLSWWQWLIMGAVPPLIIALYFLKLKRIPLEVPSTYLWHRAIEDLHVNSLWQRLRTSLLLFLQLLLVMLIALALLRPGWQGGTLEGNRFIFLLDTSASMSANDVNENRLEEAKRQVETLIDEMKSGDVGMIISFSDVPIVEQQFTDNRRLLHDRLANIRITHRVSDIDGALRVAAGLANPERSGNRNDNDIAVADPMPADMYILSDGKMIRPTDFALGNLEPEYIPIGNRSVTNLAIAAFSFDQNPETSDYLQAFARLEHHQKPGDEDSPDSELQVDVNLYLNDELTDAATVVVPKGGESSLDFELPNIENGTLRLEMDVNDELAVDNTAFACIQPVRSGKALLVTPGCDALEMVLSTEEAEKLVELTLLEPTDLEQEIYQKRASTGFYDLIIYDQCSPREMPQANTLFIGELPPGGRWQADNSVSTPQIIDTNQAHPLMLFVDLSDVRFAEARPLSPPPGSTILMDANAGPIAAIAPRDGFEDVVLGLFIVNTSSAEVHTDWPLRYSFPVFMNNLMNQLGTRNRWQHHSKIQPGDTVTLRTENNETNVKVISPAGVTTNVARSSLGVFSFAGTHEVGVYEVRDVNSNHRLLRFPVNLFNRVESNILPADQFEIGYSTVRGNRVLRVSRYETWKYLLFAVLALLLLEWYVFNRRVYF